LNCQRVGIAGSGVVCALGSDGNQVAHAIVQGRSGLGPLTRFKVLHPPALPVGEALDLGSASHLPPTIRLARLASDQAMVSARRAPDAIVIGVTTGGMAVTEELLKQGCTEAAAYAFHGLGSVARDLARRYYCHGPVLTISTACSSGACAIALAAAMIRSGHYQRILTGGVDSLCRLTYYGFKSLQLIDPQGARPLDQDRRGMSVSEGAGMLWLEAADDDFQGIEVLGAGLSCDAHHPAQPHPQGLGALSAMQSALAQAGLEARAVDYINLHGTGTVENDRSEAAAITALFHGAPPPLSSVKGAVGHSLAASGAIEAVLAALCVEKGLIPANTGCRTPDPALGITPVDRSIHKSISTVLSNSFGFGGNNAAVVIGRSASRAQKPVSTPPVRLPLAATGWSAITGGGFTKATVDKLFQGQDCCGRIDTPSLCKGLPAGMIRRVKRLSQLALALLANMQTLDGAAKPQSVFFGTGWGSLSETHDFLQGLFDSGEKFSSPTDFIGSVHNAAAGQIALMAKSTGANLTLSGGDYSFEQALFSAQMLTADDDPVMVIGADEAHEKLSLLFDPSVALGPCLSDGGGALLLRKAPNPAGPVVELKYFASGFDAPPDLHALVRRLGGGERIRSRYGLVLAGIPAAQKKEGRKQIDQFSTLTDFKGGILEYRRLTGEFTTSSAVATVFAVSLVHAGRIPFWPSRDPKIANPRAGAVLILGLGSTLTAIDVGPP
jgi:3-oxoacyl-(acyl-carrier-protein) synthase